MKRIVLTAVALIVFIAGAVLCLRSILTDDPEPTPTPEVPIFTPVPVSTPTPYQRPAVRSGSFQSDTGTGLNLLVEWKAYGLSGNYEVAVDVSALSYGFYTDALYNSIVITVGEQSVALSSPAVRYDGEELVTTPLVSHSLDADPGIVPISVVWNYKGSYSGVELESITASGTADLS